MKPLILAVLVFAPADLSEVRGTLVAEGVASLYRPWRRSATVPYARYAGKWSVKPHPTDLVCAHRTLPFGTWLRLTRHDAPPAYCAVFDRGPYGFCERARRGRLSKRCKRGYRYTVTVDGKRKQGYYRGVVDATPLVHAMMESDGWEYVRVERLSLGRTRHVPRVRSLDGV